MAKRKLHSFLIFTVTVLMIASALLVPQLVDLTPQVKVTVKRAFSTLTTAAGGHWEFDENYTSKPYKYSENVCKKTALDTRDCNEDKCSPELANWVYHVGGSNTTASSSHPYPQFDVAEFRRKMRGKKILFVGSSLVRQQVHALLWTLGHTKVRWKLQATGASIETCTTIRACFTDAPSKIQICYQFLGSMATQIYKEGNYTLDHSLRGLGDSSCLLQKKIMQPMKKYDVVFVQSLAWYAGIPNTLDSEKSPRTWIETMIPTLYYDSMKAFLSNLSSNTQTVLVLGHIGTACEETKGPEAFSIENLPTKYGWDLSPKLWDASLRLIEDEQLDIQVVDAREPTMQSVHAHPLLDCLHFCSNAAALNIYLDIYWNEVFSLFNDEISIT